MRHCSKFKKIKTLKELYKRKDKCGSYKNIKIKGLDLSNLDFSNEDFSYSNLKNVKFNNTKLDNTKFINSKLEGTDFSDSKMSNTEFEKSTYNDSTKGIVESFEYDKNIYTQKKGYCDLKNLDIPLIIGIGTLSAIFLCISYLSYKKRVKGTI